MTLSARTKELVAEITKGNPKLGDQIGIHEPEFRSRCIQLGETLGLYKDERVAKNCTPSYLPGFIRIEVAKREAASS